MTIRIRNGNSGITIRDIAHIGAKLGKRLNHKPLNRGFAAEVWGSEESLAEHDIDTISTLGYEIF